jgi:hypothetical protein
VLHLAPGGRYSWVLDIDGHSDDSWRLPFETRQAAPRAGGWPARHRPWMR